jgi:hypothetical protein
MIYNFDKNSHTPKRGTRLFCISFGRERKMEWQVNMMTNGESIYGESIAHNEQINKLGGFTDGILRFKNEFQFGWRDRKDGKIDLFCYHWIDGIRPSLPDMETKYKIGLLDKQTFYTLGLEMNRNEVIFTLKHNSEILNIISIPYKTKSLFSWIFQPYIGGSETYSKPVTIFSKLTKSKNKVFTLLKV